MSKQRLDKIISSQGAHSRSEVQRLIRSGQVSVNGTAVTDCGAKTDPEQDRILLGAKPLNYRQHIFIMLNKPIGVVSASRSPADITVVDLVPPHLQRDGLFPAGRLDKDTTGLVLITDDGNFAHEILAPKKHVSKTYIALLDARLLPDELEKFRTGVTLADGYECLPAEIRELGDDGKTVEIKLREGKYHQIKRMAAACGSHVVSLERVAIGSLGLGALARGECRELSTAEVELVKTALP